MACGTLAADHCSGYRTLRHLTPVDDPMANEEHVAMLKQGVDAWNKWRIARTLTSNRTSAGSHRDACRFQRCQTFEKINSINVVLNIPIPGRASTDHSNKLYIILLSYT